MCMKAQKKIVLSIEQLICQRPHAESIIQQRRLTEACFVILSLTFILSKPSPAGCFIDCEHALIIGGSAQGLEQHELARGM